MALRMVFILLLVAMTACSNFGKYMEEGDRAFALEDYPTAIESYGLAVQEDPESIEAKQALDLAKLRYFDVLDKKARTALKAKDYVQAIQTTEEAVALVGEGHKGARALKEEVLKSVTQVADNAKDRGEFAQAIQVYEELLERFPEAIPNLPELIEKTLSDWANALAEEAQEAEKQGLLGVALLRWSKSVELSGDRSHERARARVYEDLKTHHRFDVWLEGQQNNPSFNELSYRISQADLAPGLVILLQRNDFDPVDAKFRLEFGKIEWNKSTEKTTEYMRYQKGTRQVETPEYTNQMAKVEAHQRLVDGLETELTETEMLVTKLEAAQDPKQEDSSQLVTAKKKRRTLKEDLVVQEKELTKAQSALASTTRYSDEPIMAELEYPIERHTYTATLKMRANLEFTTNIDPIPLYDDIHIQIIDVIHGAYPEAGLDVDPQQKPSVEEMENKLYVQGMEMLSSTLLEGYQLHLDRIRINGDTAPSDREQLNFYVIYASLQNQPVPDTIGQRMANISGIPNALKLVATHVPEPVKEDEPEEAEASEEAEESPE